MNRIVRWGKLFWMFLKLGFLSLGSGRVIAERLCREAVRKRGWLTKEEVQQLVAEAGTVPGILPVNVAAVTGCRVGGVLGALAAVLGLAVPSLLMVSVLSLFISRFGSVSWIGWFLEGMRAGVAVLLLFAVFSLGNRCDRTNFNAIVMAVVFVWAAFFGGNVLWLLLGAAGAGILRALLLSRRRGRRGGAP